MKGCIDYKESCMAVHLINNLPCQEARTRFVGSSVRRCLNHHDTKPWFNPVLLVIIIFESSDKNGLFRNADISMNFFHPLTKVLVALPERK